MKIEEAKNILIYKDEILKEIHDKTMALYHELLRMENSDELLAATALPAVKAVGETTGGANQTDNLDVLLRYYRRRKEYGEEIRQQMWKLSEKEDKVLRLWNCFLILPRPYYGILNELYIKKELYAVVEASSGYCHSIFEKKGKRECVC